MKKYILVVACALVGFGFSGCVAANNTAGGAVGGALVGATIAKVAGGDTSDAIIAGSGGAVAGALIGKEMDERERVYR